MRNWINEVGIKHVEMQEKMNHKYNEMRARCSLCERKHKFITEISMRQRWRCCFCKTMNEPNR